MEYKSIPADKNGYGFRLTNIAKNIVIIIAITFLLFVIFAFVITYTNIPTEAVSPVIFGITIISIIAASIINGKKADEKGWLTGGISGLVYMIILYILGSIIYRNFSINTNSIAMIISGIFAGMLGGIIGINNRKKYKR